jgi:putative Ca2+/H+ antiporter (TMEM165/GDT1 family)
MASMHQKPLVIFTGALGALIVMTVLSAAIGFTLPNLIPRSYTHYAVHTLHITI